MADDRYTIQRGDTLWDLARRWGTTVDELMRLNPQIQDRNKIYAGASMRQPVPASPPVSSQQSAPAGASLRRETVGDSSPVSPLKEMGIAGPGSLHDSGELPQMQFPGATLNAPAMNPVQQDAYQASQGMQTNPELAALQAAGLLAMIPAMTRGIPALAGAMPPALPQAGMLGNTVKGAVNWPGAAPSMSNVAPVFPNNPGAAAALVQGMLARQAAVPTAPNWSQILGGL